MSSKYSFLGIAIITGILAFSGCLASSNEAPTTGEHSFLVTNAHLSQVGDSFQVTGISDGVQVTVAASEVRALGEGAPDLNTVRCFIVVVDDTTGKAIILQVKCPEP